MILYNNSFNDHTTLQIVIGFEHTIYAWNILYLERTTLA